MCGMLSKTWYPWCWVCGVWWRCDGIRWWMVQPGPGIQHFYSTLTAQRALETFRFLSRKVWNSVFVVCWLYCDAVKSTLFSYFIFFEEKSGLLRRGEMWAQSSWEKVTVFCAENGIKWNVLFVEKLLWRLETAMEIVKIPKYWGHLVMVYCMQWPLWPGPASQSIAVQFSGWSLLTKYPGGDCDSSRLSLLELQTKVHTKVRNHGEGPYYGLLLVKSGYYRFHI